jgi:hypothetical protein
MEPIFLPEKHHLPKAAKQAKNIKRSSTVPGSRILIHVLLRSKFLEEKKISKQQQDMSIILMKYY